MQVVCDAIHRTCTRSRKPPLPALVAPLLTMRGQSRQLMLDSFFGTVCGADHQRRE